MASQLSYPDVVILRVLIGPLGTGVLVHVFGLVQTAVQRLLLHQLTDVCSKLRDVGFVRI